MQSFSVPQVKRPRLTEAVDANNTDPNVLAELILQMRRQKQGMHQTEMHTEYQARIFDGKKGSI